MRNIRKVQMLIVISVMLVCCAMPFAQSTADGALSITNLIVSPSVVVAGSNMTITFQLYSSYTSALNNVNVQLQSESQIINVSPSSSYLISSIGQGIYGGIGFDTLSYHFKIPSTLQAGVYTFDVVANYEVNSGSETLTGSSTIPISIYIYGKPQISLEALPSTQIVPGQSFSAAITAVNGGTDTATNMSITLLNSKNFSVVGATKFSLGKLTAGNSSSVSASLQPALNISSGVYDLSAILSYTAKSGIIVTQNVSIPVSIVINTPDIVLSVASAAPSSLYPGSNQTITVDIENIGLGEAKNISVSFVGSKQIGVGSVSKFFIGSLAASASYPVSVFVSASRYDNNTNYTIPVIINYSSSNLRNTTLITKSLAIDVKPTAVFNISSETGTLLPGATYKPVTFVVRNVGNEPAEQISLSLQTIYPITPSNPNGYINYLAPGQSANITFFVDVDSQGYSGSYPLTVYEQWSQPNGYTSQQYSSSTNYYAIVGGSKASSQTAKLSSTILEVVEAVVVVVIIAAIAMFIRKSRKKQKAKK